MLLCKRADLLLKQQRTHAAGADAAAALAVNPDSAKAYRTSATAMETRFIRFFTIKNLILELLTSNHS